MVALARQKHHVKEATALELAGQEDHDEKAVLVVSAGK